MKPNIIFIMIDDMGWRDLGCYGSSFYETPHIDRLCREGMAFTNAYAACPVCSPSRASYLTGKYPAVIGLTDYIGGHNRGKLIDAPYIRYLPKEEQTIADALKTIGYQTWHVGKWHLGEREYYPEYHGFDVNIGGCSWGHPKKGYFSPYGIETLEEGPEGEYLTNRLTEEAIRLIEEHSDSHFFLNLCYYAVHTPVEAPADLIEKYESKRKRIKLDCLCEMEEGECFPTQAKRTRHVMRRRIQSDPAYAAMIENLDMNIGRLMQTVSAAGLDENTIVFFYSDNGGLSTAEGSPTCNAPLSEGKGWMYEGGIREPLIVRWKNHIASGSVCETPVSSPDFFPTLLHLAGKDESETVASEIDGVDISPLFFGETLDERPLFWHYPHYGNQGGTPAAAIRLGEWKLILFFETETVELYHLKTDLSEQKEVSSVYPDVACRLQDILTQWLASVNAKIPQYNPAWNPLAP